MTQLKSQYGLGYTLTLVNAGAPSSSAASFAQTLLELVRRHVPAAATLSAVGAELTIQVRGATCHASARRGCVCVGFGEDSQRLALGPVRATLPL